MIHGGEIICTLIGQAVRQRLSGLCDKNKGSAVQNGNMRSFCFCLVSSCWVKVS